MSSSQSDKRGSDAEMGEATSQVPGLVPSDSAPACVTGFLPFREKLARRKAEKEPVHADTELPSSSVLVVTPAHEPEVQVPQDTGAQVETGISCMPDASAQPSGSSTILILVDDKEKATESMPPPPDRKEIVLALRAPSATLVVQPKGRKRRCTRGNDGESSHQEGLSMASGFRGKFVSLIDGMISKCGSEVSRVARDLTEMQGKLSESEAMLKAFEDSRSAKVSKLEVQIGELEWDLGKMASSLLKEKKARKTKSSEVRRKTKSSEVRRFQCRIESGEGSTNHGVGEAKDALRVEFQTCLAMISEFLGSLECIRSRDLALATVDGGMVVVHALQEDPEEQDPAVGENGGGAAPSLDEAMGEGEKEDYELSSHTFLRGQDLRLLLVLGGAMTNSTYVSCYSFDMIPYRFKVRDRISEDVEWKDLGLLLVLGGAMTNSTYVSRYSFDLIPYRFKVRDRFSAYMTCLVGIEQLSKDNF
ncbi:hypothetical protein DY000_02021347 [Brassica cretica]|uniref:Uncharacterized protein n=1 Tax=Brassica cretica TaxID=69181 RepID=A0ABQ7E8D7_BRACR|nr:hypothetical protein DY000_02021347 [Brassica cretica]